MATEKILALADEQIAAAKAVDLQRYVGGELRKNAHHDWQRQCPKCNSEHFHIFQSGSDNLWRWRCYHCHNDIGDAIEYVMWADNASFVDAVKKLAGGDMPTVQRSTAKAQPVRRQQDGEWKERNEARVKEAQRRLWAPEGAPGREYLAGRGLEPLTWQVFGLGYSPYAYCADVDGGVPAIVMPWVSKQTGMFAVRFRYLQAQGEQRLISSKGSIFEGKLYGGHVLDGADAERAQRTLLVIEGELNAMSCWQVAQDAGLDVLSMGSHNTTITDNMVSVAGQYGRVLVWLDRADMAAQAAQRLPDAYAIRSPYRKDASGNTITRENKRGELEPVKMDANDMLQAGTLGLFLAAMRIGAARSNSELEQVLAHLLNAAATLHGVDDGTAKAINGLAAKLGHPDAVVEVEQGRWVAASKLRAWGWVEYQGAGVAI